MREVVVTGVWRKRRPRKCRQQATDQENADLENSVLKKADLESVDLENTDLKILSLVLKRCWHLEQNESQSKSEQNTEFVVT